MAGLGERGLASCSTFTQQIIEFRKQHPVFRRRKWFQGRSIRGSDVNDLAWFRPDGEQMSDEDWGAGFAKSLGVFLNGDEIPSVDAAGRRVLDRILLPDLQRSLGTGGICAAARNMGTELEPGAGYQKRGRARPRTTGSEPPEPGSISSRDPWL